jgi:hypothetical protein
MNPRGPNTRTGRIKSFMMRLKRKSLTVTQVNPKREKIREYIEDNPDAKGKEVGK